MEIESLLHLEPLTGCHGNATSAPQLCPSSHWAWHPPSCCWFCVLPNVLLCSLRNASPFFREKNKKQNKTLIQKAGLWRQGRFNLCKLQFEKASSRMRGAINSASLWINVLYLSISNPTANYPPRFILLAFVSKGHTLFIKIPINM